MISMKQIGEICGISESTVSKALSGYPGIKDTTRTRVRAVANKYGYQPNAMVRSIQTGKSKTVGIACNRFRCQFTGEIMDGICETLHEQGYDSYVVSWDRLVKDGADLLSRFASRRVDGLILLPTEEPPTAAYIAQLYSFHNPVILVDQFWGTKEFDFVGTNNRKAMTELVEDLLIRGYKKIGAVLFSQVSSGQERRAGFLDAMFKYGIPVNAQYLCEVDDCVGDSYDAIYNFLKSKDLPEALICFNDYLAVDTINAAYDLGIKVPNDLAITGFGNLDLCKRTRPQLTTVNQHAGKIGQAAAELLLNKIDNKGKGGPCKEILIPTDIVMRGTVGKKQ